MRYLFLKLINISPYKEALSLQIVKDVFIKAENDNPLDNYAFE